MEYTIEEQERRAWLSGDRALADLIAQAFRHDSGLDECDISDAVRDDRRRQADQLRAMADELERPHT